MNSMERVTSVLAGESVDRPPVAPQLFGFTARQNGVQIGRYVRDGGTLAKCQLKAQDRFGTDILFAVSDVNVEAEAAGCELHYRDDDYPVVAEPALRSPLSVDSVSVPDPARDGRMPEMLAAVRAMRKKEGDTVPLVATVMGPMTLATLMMGTENALFFAHDDPKAFAHLLRKSAAIAKEYGQAQLRAGAHVIMVFDPSAAPIVFPKGLFFEHEEGLLTDIQKTFISAGAASAFLHIAAYTVPIMEHIRSTKTKIFSFDQSVGIDDVEEHLPGVSMVGNINVITLLEGSPSLIKADCERLLEDFRRRGRLILSSACEVPPEVPSANVIAMARAAKDWK